MPISPVSGKRSIPGKNPGACWLLNSYQGVEGVLSLYYSTMQHDVSFGVISRSIVVDTQKAKIRVSKGVQLSSQNGVVPTKSGGRLDGFYCVGKRYFRIVCYDKSALAAAFAHKDILNMKVVFDHLESTAPVQGFFIVFSSSSSCTSSGLINRLRLLTRRLRAATSSWSRRPKE